MKPRRALSVVGVLPPSPGDSLILPGPPWCKKNGLYRYLLANARYFVCNSLAQPSTSESGIRLQS